MSVPYVIEGTEGKEKVYDLYSRLLKDRIVFIGREFTEDMANSVVAQLLFLEANDPEKDIIVYINSPGGLVSACLAIFDTMQYIACDVSTICIGQASSAAAFILAAGTKGKRFALKNARIMLHQLSGGAGGHIEDMRIKFNEADILNKVLLDELSDITGHKVNKLKKDMTRDKFMSAEEAKDYGIIDKVILERGKRDNV